MAEVSIPQNACVVYWLYDEKCVCPWRHGYVGISKNWERRVQEHLASKRFAFVFQTKILFYGSRVQCLAYEEMLRPAHNVGWNRFRGGHNGAKVGYKHSDETKKKVSAALKGKKRTQETRERIRLAGLGKKRSAESRAKQSAAVKGRSKSAEWRTKASAAAIRRFKDPDQYEKRRQLMLRITTERRDYSGENNPRFGVTLSDETKRKISESQKRRLALRLEKEN